MTRVITSDMVDALVIESQTSARGRQHLNLHAAYQESCQRLLNAIQCESYIRPHRHALDPRAETLFAMSGVFVLIVFDECGQVTSCKRFGSERYLEEKGIALGVEIFPREWHTVIALRADSVLLEVKAGPFDPNAAKELASWAPAEGTPESQAYLEHLKAVALDQVLDKQ